MDDPTKLNLSKGRASWTWAKIHARLFDEATADHVVEHFGTAVGCRLYKIPWDSLFILRNSAGCMVAHLYDDDAPYVH